jgi:4,5-DOPA dioxygenase extradiol
VRVESAAGEMMLAGEHRPVIKHETLGRDGALSIPTPDHDLPLLYVLAAEQKGKSFRLPITDVDGGSISMLAVQIG